MDAGGCGSFTACLVADFSWLIRHILKPNRVNTTPTVPQASGSRQRETFLVELIKPSHYDDDGYVIQWWRGWIPSNSLSCLYGLALDSRARRVLGDDVDIEIQAHDETNSVIRLAAHHSPLARGQPGLVCLVGVQSNQFPRAMDIARILRRHGIQVVMGGFHVSGCLAMIPEMTPELKDALDLGITLFAGEAEGRFDEILQAAYERRLKPLYNFIQDLPGLEGQPPPYLPRAEHQPQPGQHQLI